MDLRNSMVRLFYNPQFANLKAGFLADLPKKLDEFEKYLGDKHYFAGSNVTWVDFVMYELLDQLVLLHPPVLDAFAHLKGFHERFGNLEKVRCLESYAMNPTDTCYRSPLSARRIVSSCP